jgi:hypothetical protein
MTPKLFDKLFFIGPMSLGDSFVLSGMTHYYADRCEELHYPCEHRYFKTLKTFFQDFSNIIVVPMLPFEHGEYQYVDQHKLSRIVRKRMYATYINDVHVGPLWDMQLYQMYDLPFAVRYTHFRTPKYVEGAEELYQKLSGGEPYILIHRSTSHHPSGIPIDIPGFRAANNLPNYKVIEINDGITDNMMHYLKLIENAEEIHCVSSSFFCLVDGMYDKSKAKLFFHDVRATTMMSVNPSWTVVNYASKL